MNINTPEFARLRKLISQSPAGSGWNKAWEEKLTPWEASQSQPPLRELLASGELTLPNAGRALVPGCGRGYDAILIATMLGLDTTGLDISESAVQAATTLVESSNVGPARTKISFQINDFFTLGGQFDLVYDYTFFVAIPPAQRPEWGRQMHNLIKPGGYLITLVFPIMDQPVNLGPPFFVRPEHYVEDLGDGWEKVLDRGPESSQETHKDKERLVVYRRL